MIYPLVSVLMVFIQSLVSAPLMASSSQPSAPSTPMCVDLKSQLMSELTFMIDLLGSAGTTINQIQGKTKHQPDHALLAQLEQQRDQVKLAVAQMRALANRLVIKGSAEVMLLEKENKELRERIEMMELMQKFKM